jgi:hypothetical protein
MNTAFEIVSIPLNKLVASPLNVRKTGGQTIEDLAASIQAHGLLHNLVVAKKGDKHHVIAGARRFAALRKLAKEKAIPKTFDVPCRVIDAAGSTETSLAENVIRTAMHPADQFDAFRSLVDEGMGVEEIAARFGVTATTSTTFAHISCKRLLFWARQRSPGHAPGGVGKCNRLFTALDPEVLALALLVVHPAQASSSD